MTDEHALTPQQTRDQALALYNGWLADGKFKAVMAVKTTICDIINGAAVANYTKKSPDCMSDDQVRSLITNDPEIAESILVLAMLHGGSTTVSRTEIKGSIVEQSGPNLPPNS